MAGRLAVLGAAVYAGYYFMQDPSGAVDGGRKGAMKTVSEPASSGITPVHGASDADSSPAAKATSTSMSTFMVGASTANSALGSRGQRTARRRAGAAY